LLGNGFQVLVNMQYKIDKVLYEFQCA